MADDQKLPRRFKSIPDTFVPPEPSPEQGSVQLLLSTIAWSIFRTVARGFAYLSPLTPQFVPLAVGLSVVPILAFFSSIAGYVVWKTAAVTWEHPLYLQYGDGIAPYADLRLGVVATQPYNVDLHLVVPTVPSNFVLGNFMTSLTISSLSNKTITSIRRPAIILPPAKTALSTLYRPNSLEVTVPLLSSYIIGSSKILAHVEIGRKDGWTTIGNGEGRELSVLSASLKGTVQHHGLRGLLTRNPLASSFLASGAFFAVSSALVFGYLVTATQLFTSYEVQSPPSLEELAEGKGLKKSKSREVFEERPFRQSSRRSSRVNEEVKTEVPEATIPSTDDAARSLRRRSRPSFDSA